MLMDSFIALVTLGFAGAWTPGPNNALVASSGATFGYIRTIPHILGIALGFPVMMFIVGVFLGEVFQQSAVLRQTLRWGGALILLWMAWRMANSGAIDSKAAKLRPFTFLESAAFQWINPKAWAMGIAITSQFILPTAPVLSALIIAGVFVLAGLTSASGWALAGQTLMRWAEVPGRLIWFNRAMAALIVLTVALLFLG
jgi:threonine/homoserine/homoserine lactone efflux protein